MKKILHIRRQVSPKDAPYWEDYRYETEESAATVATALLEIGENDRIAGAGPYRPIMWEHSCLQKKCGACAMLIDGRPALACDTRLADLKKEKITVEPLKKFPIIADLLVDRTVMMERLLTIGSWFEGDAQVRNERRAFEASKCLQCGLCLEVCPNFYAEGPFGGMAAMVPLARILSKVPDGQRKKAAMHYRKAVYDGCGKSLACRDICPAGVDIGMLLTKSNAAAVWNRWRADAEKNGEKTLRKKWRKDDG